MHPGLKSITQEDGNIHKSIRAAMVIFSIHLLCLVKLKNPLRTQLMECRTLFLYWKDALHHTW